MSKRPTGREAIKALGIIENITGNAESLDPKRDWKESHDAICSIYELAHWVRAPKCRKNHPSWGDALLADRKARRKP